MSVSMSLMSSQSVACLTCTHNSPNTQDSPYHCELLSSKQQVMPLLASTRKGRQQAKELKMLLRVGDAFGCAVKVSTIRGELLHASDRLDVRTLISQSNSSASCALRCVAPATSRTRITANNTSRDLAFHYRLLPYIWHLDQEPSFISEQTARENAT